MDSLAPTTRRNAASSQDLPIDAIDVPEDGLRRVATTAQQDEGMRESVRMLGVLQPIIVRAAGGAGRYRLVSGRRRLRAAREAGLCDIPAEVRADLTDADAAAIEAAENIQRAAMAPVDTWRAITRLRELGWDLDSAAAALGLGYRRAQQLEKLGTLHPEILARIEQHGLPPQHQLQEIAAAPQDVQAAAIGRERGDSEPAWWRVAEGCRTTRIPKDRAIFDTELAGVVWEEDLFAEPGSPDQWTTNDVAGFLEAQRAALLKLVEDSKGKLQIASTDKHGALALPKKWEQVWNWRFGDKPPRGATGFVLVDAQGRIVSQAAKPPAKAKPEAKKAAPERDDGADRRDAEDDEELEDGTDAQPAAPKPEEAAKGVLTRRGEELLAEARTTALRAALRDKPRSLTEAAGLALLALTADNARVLGEPGQQHTRSSFRAPAAVAWQLLQGLRANQAMDPKGMLVEAHLARLLCEVVASALICGPTPAGNASGDAAEWIGQIVGAERAMPRLDTEEFLATMSGDALRQVAPALLEDSKAGKLSVAGLRQRLAGSAPGLATQGALAGLVAFCRTPPTLEGTEHYFAGEHACGQRTGAKTCKCGWRASDGDAAGECSAARWEAELARLQPWPEPEAVDGAKSISATTQAVAKIDAPAEHACRWDGKTRCPDDPSRACIHECPRRDEYAAWWESPAGAAATATEQERAAAKLAAEAPAEPPPPAPKRGRRRGDPTNPPTSLECGWNGESLCREEGTTRCEEHCQRNGRYRTWLGTPAGKAAQHAKANAEARANLRSRRGGASQPA